MVLNFWLNYPMVEWSIQKNMRVAKQVISFNPIRSEKKYEPGERGRRIDLKFCFSLKSADF